MITAICVVTYLIIGYAFTWWFSHMFVEQPGYWSDGQRMTTYHLVSFNIWWPIMVFVIAVWHIIDSLAGCNFSNKVRKLYRL